MTKSKRRGKRGISANDGRLVMPHEEQQRAGAQMQAFVQQQSAIRRSVDQYRERVLGAALSIYAVNGGKEPARQRAIDAAQRIVNQVWELLPPWVESRGKDAGNDEASEATAEAGEGGGNGEAEA